MHESSSRTPELRWVRPPRQARSQDTLDRLLDAAEGLVAERGFEDTTIAELVRRADSSVGAFYARFRDKDSLLYALYERYLEQAMATTDVALDPARWVISPISEIVRKTVPFLVSVYRERRGLIRAFVLRNHIDAEFRARRERLSHHVSEGLSRLLIARRSEIRHPNPVRAAVFGLTMVVNTIESAVLFGDLRSGALTLSDDELGVELTRAFLAYLGLDDFSRPRDPEPAES
ncbi:TetR/AcrR family transcriptional regulator [Myxococcota bacterium]|nr:TetR/AcrR family transcriptional regulator [Myxococcota bacterium]MCZ7618194.1 TetR/AcrR family transcriptional regulator [Myxococcota bacterium]